MKAKLVLHTRDMKGDEIVEVKIWQVPMTGDKPHGVKISVVYIKNGKRLIGYDNAEGRGYHRHELGREEAYRFVDIWKMLDDFKKDVKRIRGREWDED